MKSESKILDEFVEKAHPEYSWTCAGSAAADFDGTKKAELVEMLMLLTRGARDTDGLRTFSQLPPAVAVAIIRAFDSGNPVEFVRKARREGKI